MVIKAVIKAVYDKLAGDSGLAQKLASTPGIYDRAPSGTLAPMVILGEANWDRTRTQPNGVIYDVRMLLFVYSDEPNSYDVIDVGEACEAVLNDSTLLTLSSGTVIQQEIGTCAIRRFNEKQWYVEIPFEVKVQA